MRRLLLLAALLPLLIAAKPAQASTVVLLPNIYQRSATIEQETPDWSTCGDTCADAVRYPPSAGNFCAWDIDDYDITSQILNIAGPVEAPLCVVADGFDNVGGDDHRVSADVISSKPNVTVWLTSDQGMSLPLAGVTANHQTEWTTCFFDTTPGPYPVIDGSNGGTGIPVTYTLHVTPTDRTARSVYVHFETGADGDTHWTCP